MDKPKRPRTEKQLANDKRLKEEAAKRRAEKQENTASQVELPPVPETPSEKIYSQDDVDKLKNQVEEVMQLLRLQQGLGVTPQQQGPTIQNGRVIGITERYSVDPANYPSPVERLAKETRLAPFAFDFNYDVDYEFQTTEYQTKEGIWQKEPRFKLTLSRVRVDDDGNRTNGRFLISTAFFLEDPQSAITVARQNGYDVNEMEQTEFLNEMRYIQFRDWLFEQFYPSKAFEKHSNKQEMVMDGKIVQYFEITSQNSEKMPFDKLDNKL